MVQKKRLLKFELERVRDELHRAFDAAQGDHRDPNVQALAAEFDRLLVLYMRRQRNGFSARG